MSWYLDSNNKLKNADLPVSIEGDYIVGDASFSAPMYGYPATFWHVDSETNSLQINNNYHTYFNVPPIVDHDPDNYRDDNEVLVPPYPASFWYYSQRLNRLNMDLIPMELIDSTGAFADCRKLKYVKIPRSVKSIGKYSFANTALRSVTIASDCTYYDTSFPDGCVINYY